MIINGGIEHGYRIYYRYKKLLLLVRFVKTFPTSLTIIKDINNKITYSNMPLIVSRNIQNL